MWKANCAFIFASEERQIDIHWVTVHFAACIVKSNLVWWASKIDNKLGETKRNQEWKGLIKFSQFVQKLKSMERMEEFHKILGSYGTPQKTVTLIKQLRYHFEWSIIIDSILFEWFPLESGTRQGCVVSFKLLITIDCIVWIMSDRRWSIEWTSFSLRRTGFVRALHSSILSKGFKHNAFQTGLNISASKTKFMCINTSMEAHITINGEALEDMEDTWAGPSEKMSAHQRTSHLEV